MRKIISTKGCSTNVRYPGISIGWDIQETSVILTEEFRSWESCLSCSSLCDNSALRHCRVRPNASVYSTLQRGKDVRTQINSGKWTVCVRMSVCRWHCAASREWRDTSESGGSLSCVCVPVFTKLWYRRKGLCSYYLVSISILIKQPKIYLLSLFGLPPLLGRSGNSRFFMGNYVFSLLFFLLQIHFINFFFCVLLWPTTPSLPYPNIPVHHCLVQCNQIPLFVFAVLETDLIPSIHLHMRNIVCIIQRFILYFTN